ncbi:MAG: redoxin domain-containing protein [Saprospiraceae bacterium]|nr:redoxin domain-containing protein [Saprospiraceae bacterium]
MKRHFWYIILLLMPFAATVAQSPSFTRTKLKNLENKTVKLSHFIEDKPIILVAYGSDCPICQKYVPILRGMSDTFSTITFIFVFSKWDSLQAIKDFVNEVGDKGALSHSVTKNIYFLWDKKNKLLKKLKATTTPEAFLFDRNKKQLYRGAIDNWFFALGKYRPQATEFYLKNALTQFLNNEKITVPQTHPIGCIIEY